MCLKRGSRTYLGGGDILNIISLKTLGIDKLCILSAAEDRHWY